MSARNLITSDDIHPVKNFEENNSPANIHTIDEVDEEEQEEQEQENEQPSNLLVIHFIFLLLSKTFAFRLTKL